MIFRADIANFRLLDESREITANYFRGALGAWLHGDPELYRSSFDPYWADGPSGYRTAPRPFVLRCRRAEVELITFRTELESIFAQAMARTCPMEMTSTAPRALPMYGREWNGSLKLQFVTPTAMKHSGGIASEPHFKVLVQRLVERVRALGHLYQGWPATVDFSSLLLTADQVQLVRHDWRPESGEQRRSARSGHSHELRGYVGSAEYGGPVGGFVPLLEIGRYTGVGRNTVWGNGEIRIMELSVSDPSSIEAT